MIVKVREVIINKGEADKNGNPFHFAKVKVRNEDKSICMWVNIDNKVFPSDKIKKGDVLDIYFKAEGSIHVSDVEVIVGNRASAQNTNQGNYEQIPSDVPLPFDEVVVDTSTGELTSTTNNKNKKN